MKKILSIFLIMAAIGSCSACGASEHQDPPSAGATEESAATSSQETSKSTSSETVQRQITVQFGENTLIYELNDSTAADSLYEQLPITIEVEDYSTNEKIFYPSQELDTSDSPTAQGEAGTLAYYEPWGDEVFFYGDYSENSSLYELGQIVPGQELISEMGGTIIIKAAE